LIERVLNGVTVLPTLVVDAADDAPRVCEVLCEAGIAAVEIALRTPVALAAIGAVARARLPIVVGAGTLTSPDEMARARDAGAAFGVSPGATDELANAALRMDWPWLPGVATASEVLRVVAHGFRVLKLFPTSIALLDALRGPFPSIEWVPTGGVNAENAADYLSRREVFAVSGTWIAPRALIRQRSADEIRRRASEIVRICSEIERT